MGHGPPAVDETHATMLPPSRTKGGSPSTADGLNGLCGPQGSPDGLLKLLAER